MSPEPRLHRALVDWPFHGAHLRTNQVLTERCPLGKRETKRKGEKMRAQLLYLRGTSGIKPTSFNINIILS